MTEVETQTAKINKPKRSPLKIFIIVSIILAVLCGASLLIFLVLSGISKQASSTDNGPAGAARNYTYKQPSQTAKNRVIDCNKDFRTFMANPKNVLCLNLYQTSPDAIQERLTGNNYDNILLYGENTFLDVATNINKPADFAKRVYDFAKFTDSIALPKLMSLYGVDNLNYINKDFAPYPGIYYEVRNQAEVNKSCSSQYNVGGCTQFHFLVVMLEDVITGKDQISKSFAWSRNETDDHLFYRRTVPIDCYTSHILLHETAHSLLYAREHTIEGMSLTGNTSKTPRWFNEEQAGMTHIVGFEQICGADIISDVHGTFARKVENADFLKFQSVFPSNPIAGGSPSNDCQRAILTSFYKYLSQGEIDERMPKIMTKIREKSKVKGFLEVDRNFASLILGFHGNDLKEKKFLNSKGCGI